MNPQQRLQRLENSRARDPSADSELPDFTIFAEELRELGLDPEKVIVDGRVIVDGDKAQYIGTLGLVRTTKDPAMQNFTMVIDCDPREYVESLRLAAEESEGTL